MKRIIYLAGPMKGYPEKNFPLFEEVATKLRNMGHRVYSPHEFPNNSDGSFDLRKAFAMYSNFICLEADTLVLLPNWEPSLGVLAELSLAENCRLDLFLWEEDTPFKDGPLIPFVWKRRNA